MKFQESKKKRQVQNVINESMVRIIDLLDLLEITK